MQQAHTGQQPLGDFDLRIASGRIGGSWGRFLLGIGRAEDEALGIQLTRRQYKAQRSGRDIDAMFHRFPSQWCVKRWRDQRPDAKQMMFFD